MFTISTACESLCFIHPCEGVLLTLLHLLTSQHLSTVLAGILVIHQLLGELTMSNHWVDLLGFLWAPFSESSLMNLVLGSLSLQLGWDLISYHTMHSSSDIHLLHSVTLNSALDHTQWSHTTLTLCICITALN